MSLKGIEIVERRHNVAQILLGTLKSVAMEDQESINDGGLHVKALFRARLIKVTHEMCKNVQYRLHDFLSKIIEKTIKHRVRQTLMHHFCPR